MYTILVKFKDRKNWEEYVTSGDYVKMVEDLTYLKAYGEDEYRLVKDIK